MFANARAIIAEHLFFVKRYYYFFSKNFESGSLGRRCLSKHWICLYKSGGVALASNDFGLSRPKSGSASIAFGRPNAMRLRRRLSGTALKPGEANA